MYAWESKPNGPVEPDMIDVDLEDKLRSFFNGTRHDQLPNVEEIRMATSSHVALKHEVEVKTCRHWSRVACIVGNVLVVALTVAFTATVLLRQPTAPTISPSLSAIFELVAPASFDKGASLGDPLSPQSAAARWLSENAYLDNYTDARKLQRYALATLYYSTHGEDWTSKQNWLSDSNECEDWLDQEDPTEGGEMKLSCDKSDSITVLTFKKGNLKGSIPEEIALLSNSLSELTLEDIDLSGSTLPTTLGLMSKLTTLELRKNSITNSIPSSFGLLTSLTRLSLYDNLLSGSIPSEMAQMTSLKDLWIDKNKFEGQIDPITLSSLTNLHTLHLGENNLQGSIPSEIGLLSSLNRLKIQRNQLTGSLPEELGLLTLMNDLELGDNSFTGSLLSFKKLTKLKHFDANSNALTGSIPDSIDRLTSLEKLMLANNALTGTIPDLIYNFANIQEIHLFNNAFVGNSTCPSTVMDCFLSCFDKGNESCRTL